VANRPARHRRLDSPRPRLARPESGHTLRTPARPGGSRFAQRRIERLQRLPRGVDLWPEMG
jgi:hypothetical protein